MFKDNRLKNRFQNKHSVRILVFISEKYIKPSKIVVASLVFLHLIFFSNVWTLFFNFFL
jgi:hypothetical protein